MIDRLWRAYRLSPTDEHRNALVLQYQPLVSRIAAKLSASCQFGAVSLEDLRQTGTIGLMQAIATFDPTRRVHFSSYASRRIHGAMLDWLRDLDFVPRLARTRGATTKIMPVGNSTSTSEDATDDTDWFEAHGTPARENTTRDIDNRDTIRRLFASFPRRTLLIFFLYHGQQLTFREIGQALGLSESRVSQLHTNAIAKLRERFGHHRLLETIGKRLF